jgi:hypothetical protein
METIMAWLSKTISMIARRRKAPKLIVEFADLVRTLKALFDPYRPELHYMRGPGPKWHAKHDPTPAFADSLSVMPWTATA